MFKKDLSPLQKRYREFFLHKLHSFGVQSPASLTKDEKSVFFSSIKNEWSEIKNPPKIKNSTLSTKSEKKSITERRRTKLLFQTFVKTFLSNQKQGFSYLENYDIEHKLQLIDHVFEENKLIGNYDFSEDDYSFMLEFVGDYSKELLSVSNACFDDKSFKLIFATLVEIAKRWKTIVDDNDEEEDKSGYWDFVFKVLINDEQFNQKLYDAFKYVISKLISHSELPIVETGKKYYATIMMHSLVPKSSIHSFFDLCYNIYKNDFDYGFTSDDEWLCEDILKELRKVLNHGYREDKKVSIGSSAYAIKIGLRSFALHSNLTDEFVSFIKHTFYKIHKLFNREQIEQDSRLNRYLVEWWNNKTVAEKLSDRKTITYRYPTTTKHNIIVKYIRDVNNVLLYIPPIRLDDETNIIKLDIYVEQELVYSDLMWTKYGELVITTKPIEFELNKLLSTRESLKIRVEITENNILLFDSEKTNATSLHREFILFDNDKEIYSQILKPTNYFLYAPAVDKFKSIPIDITRVGTNLFNIYPHAGESISGNVKQVYFVDKEKSTSLGSEVCLVGNLSDVEWLFEDESYLVYRNGVKLLIPENLNLKALELRIGEHTLKLNTIPHERIESKYVQYGLVNLKLLIENKPVTVSLFSYESGSVLLSENIVVNSTLEIKFDKLFYYGNAERKVSVLHDGTQDEVTMKDKENEVCFSINRGMLIIKVPYLKWRINTNKWHYDPVVGVQWYKHLLESSDLLEIDCQYVNQDFQLFGSVDNQDVEIVKSHDNKFQLGRFVYNNEGKSNIRIYLKYGEDVCNLCSIATKEYFTFSPISVKEGMFCWEVENNFIGDNKAEFLLTIFSITSNHKFLDRKVGLMNCDLVEVNDDIYEVKIVRRSVNLFIKDSDISLIYNDIFFVGEPGKYRFYNKKLHLSKVKCNNNQWVKLNLPYYIDRLELIEEDRSVFYKGRLVQISQTGEVVELNKMINEDREYDVINPVRVEFRSVNSLWCHAGLLEGHDVYLGSLYCNLIRETICCIAKENSIFSEITYYIFKEVENV